MRGGHHEYILSRQGVQHRGGGGDALDGVRAAQDFIYKSQHRRFALCRVENALERANLGHEVALAAAHAVAHGHRAHHPGAPETEFLREANANGLGKDGVHGQGL